MLKPYVEALPGRVRTLWWNYNAIGLYWDDGRPAWCTL